MKFIIPILFLFTLVSACKPKELESPEQFMDRLIPVIQSGNEAALFDLFVHEKSEIRKIAIVTMGLSPNMEHSLEKEVDNMVAAAQEDKGRMIRRFQRGTLGDWSAVHLESVSIDFPSADEIPESAKANGVAVARINALLTAGGEQVSMRIPCVSFDNGPWKMAGYPSVD